jgi:hypothetical protein
MEPDIVLAEIVEILNSNQIEYAVMGGLAVKAYAIPRNTKDVDVTVSISVDEVPALIAILRKHDFEVTESSQRGWLDRVAGMPVMKVIRYHEGKAIEVDLFIAETEFQRSVISRRRTYDTPEGTFDFVSAEDLVLLKLVASRPRDLLDVQDVLFTMGQLDESYLRKWAKFLAIEERLNKALSEL